MATLNGGGSGELGWGLGWEHIFTFQCDGKSGIHSMTGMITELIVLALLCLDQLKGKHKDFRYTEYVLITMQYKSEKYTTTSNKSEQDSMMFLGNPCTQT